MTKISEQIKEIANLIGDFYLNKNKGDYQKAAKEIYELQITDLCRLVDNIVVITTGRPGLLIGKKGDNIFALIDWLKRPIKIQEAEDSLLDYLIPQPPDLTEYHQATTATN